MKKINIKGFDCEIIACEESNRLVYMIYPALVPLDETWLTGMSKEYGVNIAVVYVPADGWNNDLTPWPEPPESKGFEPFGGNASEFLETLRNYILPSVEKELNLSPGYERKLIGVSLSGLFTLWEWMICDLFTSIACLSGSFWYAGFLEWFNKQPVPQKRGKAFFLLGDKEPHANIKAYQSVGVNTEAIVKRLENSGMKVTFTWVAGNHFADPLGRAEKAFENLYK